MARITTARISALKLVSGVSASARTSRTFEPDHEAATLHSYSSRIYRQRTDSVRVNQGGCALLDRLLQILSTVRKFSVHGLRRAVIDWDLKM